MLSGSYIVLEIRRSARAVQHSCAVDGPKFVTFRYCTFPFALYIEFRRSVAERTRTSRTEFTASRELFATRYL